MRQKQTIDSEEANKKRNSTNVVSSSSSTNLIQNHHINENYPDSDVTVQPNVLSSTSKAEIVTSKFNNNANTNSNKTNLVPEQIASLEHNEQDCFVNCKVIEEVLKTKNTVLKPLMSVEPLMAIDLTATSDNSNTLAAPNKTSQNSTIKTQKIDAEFEKNHIVRIKKVFHLSWVHIFIHLSIFVFDSNLRTTKTQNINARFATTFATR